MGVPQMQGIAALQGVLGNLAQAIRMGRYPWWYPDEAKGLAIDYFVYGTDWLPLVASTTTQNNINISGDSAFVVLSGVIIETATDNTTVLTVPPLLFRLQDTGSGRYLSNIAVHAANWFGTAQQPKYWDIPKILAPNGTFAVEAQNLEAVNRQVRVDFHGFKIFNFNPAG
jgi:hypothetical protein